MAWTNYLMNKNAITNMYSETSLLYNVLIHEIIFSEYSSIYIRVDLNDLPNNPPTRWLREEFNCVQLTLTLIDIQDFKMKGWEVNSIVNINILEKNNQLYFTIVGDKLEINCCSNFFKIEKISPYYNEF